MKLYQINKNKLYLKSDKFEILLQTMIIKFHWQMNI